ncbi:uncharacterized protein EV422DRAFT_507133 [Fimicolochytrium jonesii]|uniref:uncharacterized protein n=1 Tax=Fimicolochytrium jonesii TaxID=1396493 RepID=UPI0022FF0F42|nr:uncharacterized protein EV422DRAFT_507133 [Fimicolochytrium jonesii]KAI8819970.1 hypothetical protein EV422DRAFT_507133 [Fimicolochytrium jonesii]
MRPDPHKAKATKQWKAKHGTAALSPKHAASTAKPQSSDDHHRRPATEQTGHVGGGLNGTPPRSETTDGEAEVEAQEHKPRSKYARRPLASNAYRYHEPTEDEIRAADEGIDRATEHLRALIGDADEEYDPAMYFQFRDEKGWAQTGAMEDAATDELNRTLLQLDIRSLADSLATIPLHTRLDVDEAELAGLLSVLPKGATGEATPTDPLDIDNLLDLDIPAARPAPPLASSSSQFTSMARNTDTQATTRTGSTTKTSEAEDLKWLDELLG